MPISRSQVDQSSKSTQNASAGSAIIVSAPVEMRARCAAVSGIVRSMKYFPSVSRVS